MGEGVTSVASMASCFLHAISKRLTLYSSLDYEYRSTIIVCVTQFIIVCVLQLMKNLAIKVKSSVAADWSKLGIMSHSLGAMYITEMLQTNYTFAKASKMVAAQFKFKISPILHRLQHFWIQPALIFTTL